MINLRSTHLAPVAALLAWATMFLPGTNAWPDEARLVKDINPVAYSNLGSDPRHLVVVDGSLYFTAYDANLSRGLWRSNGEPNGAQLIKSPAYFALDRAAAIGGTLYFQIGMQLWKTDGTAQGTLLVKDTLPEGYPNQSAKAMPVNVAGTLFFEGADEAGGRALWKSDGTAAGSVLVKSGAPENLTSVNGTLFFTYSDPDHGRELWRSNGAPEDTVLVRDLCPGPCDGVSFSFRMLQALGASLLFTGQNGPSGPGGLWRSDGTEVGTTLVKEGPAEWLTSAEGVAFFQGPSDTLWRTDGTPEGTERLGDPRRPARSRPDRRRLRRALRRALEAGASDGVAPGADRDVEAEAVGGSLRPGR